MSEEKKIIQGLRARNTRLFNRVKRLEENLKIALKDNIDIANHVDKALIEECEQLRQIVANMDNQALRDQLEQLKQYVRTLERELDRLHSQQPAVREIITGVYALDSSLSQPEPKTDPILLSVGCGAWIRSSLYLSNVG